MVVDSGYDNAGESRDGRDATGQADDTPTGSSTVGGNQPGSGHDPLDPRALALDWITLWQSELSALAADPEMREAWQTMATLWAGAMAAMLQSMLQSMPRGPVPGRQRDRHDRRHDRPAGRAGTVDASGTAPVATAPDARDAEIDRLARHVGALERRLAELERGGRPAVDPKRRPRRKP